MSVSSTFAGCPPSHVCRLPRLIATAPNASLQGVASQPMPLGVPVALGALAGGAGAGGALHVLTDPCCHYSMRCACASLDVLAVMYCDVL